MLTRILLFLFIAMMAARIWIRNTEDYPDWEELAGRSDSEDQSTEGSDVDLSNPIDKRTEDEKHYWFKAKPSNVSPERKKYLKEIPVYNDTKMYPPGSVFCPSERFIEKHLCTRCLTHDDSFAFSDWRSVRFNTVVHGIPGDDDYWLDFDWTKRGLYCRNTQATRVDKCNLNTGEICIKMNINSVDVK